MLDSAQDLVAVLLSLAFVWLLSGRPALGKQREPRGAPPAPSKARPSGFSRRPDLKETSGRLIRPKLRSEVTT